MAMDILDSVEYDKDLTGMFVPRLKEKTTSTCQVGEDEPVTETEITEVEPEVEEVEEQAEASEPSWREQLSKILGKLGSDYSAVGTELNDFVEGIMSKKEEANGGTEAA